MALWGRSAHEASVSSVRSPCFFRQNVSSLLRRLLCLSLVFAHGVFSPGHAAQPKRPNVLIVLTDDQGMGDFSCQDNPTLKTPNLDRLQAQSVRLAAFHVAPMCTPTRGQLMTGQDAVRNGATSVTDGRAFPRPGIPTMPSLFCGRRLSHGNLWKMAPGRQLPAPSDGPRISGGGADLLISRARSAMPLRHVIPAVETLAFKPDAGALTVAVPTFTRCSRKGQPEGVRMKPATAARKSPAFWSTTEGARPLHGIM